MNAMFPLEICGIVVVVPLAAALLLTGLARAVGFLLHVDAKNTGARSDRNHQPHTTH